MTTSRLRCRRCAGALTGPLTRLAELPERRRADEDGHSMLPTVPAGAYAVDPDPIAWHEHRTPAGTLGCLVMHPSEAVRHTKAHPDPSRNSGCCGHDGMDGPNLVCRGCGAEVATLADDCWTVQEVRFEPDAVRVEEVWTG